MSLGVHDAVREALETALRRQTYIARMGMSMGFVWSQWSGEARAAIMELVDGEPGLHDKIVEWAVEFDRIWEERGAIVNPDELPDGSDFPEQIAAFVDAKIKALMVEARLTQ